MAGVKINELTAAAALQGTDIVPIWQGSTVGATAARFLAYVNNNATLSVTNGATGVTSYTTGDILYASGASTLSKLAIGSTEGYVLARSSSALPAWEAPRIVVSSQSVNYAIALTDGGKVIFHPASDNNTRTYTIPANASVAFPVGSTLTFVNLAASAVTIAITSDTLTLLPDGTTGSRSLGQYGIATAIKVAATEWVISGNAGLT